MSINFTKQVTPPPAIRLPAAKQPTGSISLREGTASPTRRGSASAAAAAALAVVTGLVSPRFQRGDKRRGRTFRETNKVNIQYDAEGRRQAVNQYTFQEELGHGSYGTVIKATSSETGEMFAIKIVDKRALKRIRVGRFGNALQSVKKELKIWKRLKHLHIVALCEVIDANDSDELFMVSELVDGGTVLNDETDCTPLDLTLAKTYFCQLIEGIDFLHSNRIIHRDIKPGNLLLKKHGDEFILKIADFGVSHELEEDDDMIRQTAGTATFSAPEMLTGDRFHGKPVDIWACGITLYMFVYGHPPFRATSLPELYSMILKDPIAYPDQVEGRVVDDQLIDLMEHLLEKDPTKRYRSDQIRSHPHVKDEFVISTKRCLEAFRPRRGSLSSTASVALVKARFMGIFARRKPVIPVTNVHEEQAAAPAAAPAPTPAPESGASSASGPNISKMHDTGPSCAAISTTPVEPIVLPSLRDEAPAARPGV